MTFGSRAHTIRRAAQASRGQRDVVDASDLRRLLGLTQPAFERWMKEHRIVALRHNSTNSLATRFPRIAKQWHPTENRAST